MPSDEVDCVAVDEVSRVAVLLDLFPTIPPVVLHAVTDMTDEVDVAAVVANEFVEAVVLRM